jgi:serine/threonine-protein kinase
MSEWVGRTVSKVEIQKLLGRGGMAEVYLGRHTTLNRPVAVKILHAHLSEDSMLLGRFRSEAQAVASMRHPNIVQVFDFDIAGDRPYIVMELLEGPSLKDYLEATRRQRTVLPLETTARLVTALASALDYAHVRGVIHRDVKPANVMLRRESGVIDPMLPLPPDVEPVLTDFGVARMANAEAQTASGTIIGTPAYMSPEQVRGETVDGRSDIYSLGIMVYEMLSGVLPFDGDSQASILVQHITQPPPPLPNASRELQAVVDRALAKSPAERFQKAGDLARALRTALGVSGVAGEGPEDSYASPYPSASPLDSQTVQLTSAGLASETPAPASASSGGQTAVMQAGFNPLWIVAGIGLLALVVSMVVLAVVLRERSVHPAVSLTPAPVVEGTENIGVADTDLEVSGTDTSPVSAGMESAVPMVDTATPRGLALFQDATLSVTLTDVAPPPGGQVYEAWLREPGQASLSVGTVEVEGGRVTLTFTDTEGDSLLSQYSGFALSLRPASGPEAAEPDRIVYEGYLAPEAIQRIRLMQDVWGSQPLRETMLQHIPMQAGSYDSHLGFAINSINSGSLEGGKAHAEHVINITVGREGQEYGDWNGNGLAENPGDDVGLRTYLLILIDAARVVASAADVDAATQAAAEDVIRRSEELLQVLEDGVRLARRVASADTLDEVTPLVPQLEGVHIESAVAALMQEAETLGLGIGVQVFAVNP